MHKRIYVLIILAFLLTNLLGITLMSWEFSGGSGSEVSVAANVVAANVSSTAPSGVISRGAGLTAAGNADRFNATNWQTTTSLATAITNNKYMQFVISPGSSYAMNITSLHFHMERSSTGPTAFTFRSSVDDYATDLGSFTTSATTGINQTLPITTISNQTGNITFRMYGYSASGTSGSAGFEGSNPDLEIIGTVAPNYSTPTVTTGSISAITHYGCLAAGTVVSDGGSSITGRGIVVSATTNPQIGGVGVTQFPDASATTGAFSESVTGLAASTLYYVNSYASNNGGTAYGTETSFTTSSFPAPILLPASNITNVSFRANWQPVTNAQSYRLDVATQPIFSVGGSSTLINEGFNSVGSSGTPAPTGWTFSGITSTYTGAGYFGVTSPSIKFDTTNDNVVTPTLANPNSISFWVKGTSTASTTSSFLIEEFSNAAWVTVATLTPSGIGDLNLPTSGTVKTFPLQSTTTKIRFTYTKDAGNVGLDDVLITGNYTPNTYVTGYNDLLVTGTSQSVTGLTPNTEYFYRVRAFSTSSELSANSNTDSVTVVYSGSVDNPSNLVATASSSSSVSLTWQQNTTNDNVLVAYSTSNTFGTPSGSYAVGASITGGGTVIFNANGTTYSHNGLNPTTTYYYKAWSVDLENHYSTAISANATTQSGSSERIKVTYIDVRQGDACLIQRGTHNYLIDSGKDLSSNKLMTYLISKGVTHLDAIMISHPDFDHYGEFPQMLESLDFTVDKFVKNSDNSTSTTWATLMADIAAQGIPIQTVNNTSSLSWVLDTTILNPPPDRTSENDRSIVMKMMYGNISFLFTGDMELATNAYITSNFDVNIDVLKVSHHGSINGTSMAFLTEASPAISVISVGNNSFGHPSYTVTGMLETVGSQIYSTALDWNTWTGAGSNDLSEAEDIVLETDGTNIWVNDVLAWSKPTISIDPPQNVSISTSSSQLDVSWDSVPTATSYQVFSTSLQPYTTYTDITSSGSFNSSGGRVTWTATTFPTDMKRFYYVKAFK